jgi:hypothetical protein
MALNLSPDARMTLRANHNTVPLLEGGQVDRNNVTRVQILSIEYNRR